MENELISIVLPTYNGEKYLIQSIQSCLNQTYKNFELIIIDDCSTQSISSLVANFNDPRIKYFRNEKNQGLPESLNIGFKKSSGSYLTWTSDDNYYHNEALSVMIKALNEKRSDFIYADYWVIDENGKTIKSEHVLSPQFLDFKNCVGACFLYKRSVYEKIGSFEKEFLLAEDYRYWLKVRKNFKMANLPVSLYYYRQHAKSLSGQFKKLKVAQMALWASKDFISPFGLIYQLLKIAFYQIKKLLPI